MLSKQTHADQQKQIRDRALRILYRIEVHGAYASRLLDAVARDPSINHRDAAMVQRLVKGTLERRGTLDWMLNRKLRRGLGSLTPWIRNCLRMGAYQIIFMDNVSRSSSVYYSVELARRYGHQGTAGLVNAVLRHFPTSLEDLDMPSIEDDPADHIAVLHSHPRWIVARWIREMGLAETARLCEADNQQWPICARTNTLRVTTAQLRAELESESVRVEPAWYDPDCTLLRDFPENTSLHDLSAFQHGLFQVQDESHALVSRLVAPRSDETVVDLCAAPGGKTTHLATLMENKGTVDAVDVHPGKLDVVRRHCERLGVTNVRTVAADGRSFQLGALVDRVLVDAPCSGLGMLGRQPDARWRRQEDDIPLLSHLQGELLENAARLLRPGGRLVYSTCTIEPEENERVVERFLGAHPNFKLVPADTAVSSELTDVRGYYQARPHLHGIGGAFGAILENRVG